MIVTKGQNVPAPMRSWAEAVQGRFGATGEQLQLVSLYVKVFFFLLTHPELFSHKMHLG